MQHLAAKLSSYLLYIWMAVKCYAGVNFLFWASATKYSDKYLNTEESIYIQPLLNQGRFWFWSIFHTEFRDMKHLLTFDT